MKRSITIKVSFVLVAILSLFTISCGDGDSKETRDTDSISEFNPNEKIIVRASISRSADSLRYQDHNQNQNTDNSLYMNRRFNTGFSSMFNDPFQSQNLNQNSNQTPELFGLTEDLEFVKVPADIQIDASNIDEIFNSSEHIFVTQNIVDSLDFGFREQTSSDEDLVDSNSNPGSIFSSLYPYQQGSIPTVQGGSYSYEESVKTTKRVIIVPTYYPASRSMYYRGGYNNYGYSFAVPSRFQRTSAYENGSFGRLNEQYSDSDMNQDSLDNNQEYYLNNEGEYVPYSMDESSSLEQNFENLAYLANTTCTSEEGCFFFTKLDNFATRFVTEENIGSLWNYTAVSFRPKSCSSIDCTTVINLEGSFISESSYSYAVYSVQ